MRSSKYEILEKVILKVHELSEEELRRLYDKLEEMFG